MFLLFVPTARETVILPPNITFEISCDSSTQHFILSSIEPYSCNLNLTTWNNLQGNNLVQCGQQCWERRSSNFSDNTSQQNQEVFPKFPLDLNANLSISYKNVSHTFSTVFGAHPQFTCVNDGERLEQCNLNYGYNITDSFKAVENSEMATESPQHSRISFSQLNLMQPKALNTTASSKYHSFSIEGPIMFDGELHSNPRCVIPQPSSEAEKPISDVGCETKCYLQMERKTICTNDRERKVIPLNTDIHH